MNMGIVSVHAWPRLGKGTDAACPQVMLLASQTEWGLNLGGSAAPRAWLLGRGTSCQAGTTK